MPSPFIITDRVLDIGLTMHEEKREARTRRNF